MQLFTSTYKSQAHLELYMARLKLGRQLPTLSFLNHLISAHQHSIPFENLSRISDYHEQPEKFPTLDVYLARSALGYGGVCWSLARSFHWLLLSLGFKVSYLYMDPGHVCLKVKLDQDYYVEVGYGAPIFRAAPLAQSFTITTNAENFDYQFKSIEVVVVRTPGPTKILSLNPVSEEEIERQFRIRNSIAENKFLQMTLIQKFSEGHLVRLKDGVLTDYRQKEVSSRKLDQKEITSLLENFFMIEPAVYFKAIEYLTREIYT